MATTQAAAPESTLQDLAKRHLWLHFSRMGAYAEADIPIIVKGDGCYVWDEHGNKYLDGLSALFCVNIGHGRADVAQAGADQAKELGFFTTWSYAHPRAIELAARLASLAPGDLNRVFFTSGGGESVETALNPPRPPHAFFCAGGRGGGGRPAADPPPPVPQAHRQAEQDEVHRARGRVSR